MNATAAHRTYGYGRVSTVDQTTDNQRLELEAAGFAIAASGGSWMRA